MAITRLATYSINQGLQKSETFLAGQENASWFDSIASVKFGSGVTGMTVTFSNIPGNYKHLQLRVVERNGRGFAGNVASSLIQFNSDSTANYSAHYMIGSNTSKTVGALTNTNWGFYGDSMGHSSTTGMYSIAVCDILDYSNSNKFKSIRSINGCESNTTASAAAVFSSTWRSTAIITSITLLPKGAAEETIMPGSAYYLYGIKD